MKGFLYRNWKNMLFHIYLFVLLAGIGIGSVEYIRWCDRSLPASADIPPEIALTFDDGPHPVYTKKLLDGLRKRGVKATFFLIGENIEGNEELVKQIGMIASSQYFMFSCNFFLSMPS